LTEFTLIARIRTLQNKILVVPSARAPRPLRSKLGFAASFHRIVVMTGMLVACLVAAGSGEAQPAFTLSAGWQLQSAAAVSAPGNVISQTNYAPSGWYPATVPGTVLTSLVNAGVYPEPLYGTNNYNIPDSLCLTSYWYRTTFVVPTSYAGQRVWLNFKGINYTAVAWLNGRDLGTNQGAFARGTYDITAAVNPGGSNALAVWIQPEPNPGTPHQKTIASGVGSNGGATGTDGPTFLCSVGWDWIPTIRDRDSGIWQDVTVSASGPVVIQNPYVTSQVALPGLGSADLTMQATVSNATAVAQSGILTGSVDGTNNFSQSVTLAANSAQTLTFSPSNAPALHVVNPLLWWPNGYGPQNLHNLVLSFAVAGLTSDTQDVSFGIRQMSYTLAGSANLALSVNGVPVVAKGGDWGMDEALKRIPTNYLAAAIQMHQEANYTIIRNWVGQSTSEEFYNLCDQYGIMVWDEFFQPNPSDGPNPTNTVLYLANVQEKILRFRNHPCIALWCGRNEGNPAPAAVATGNSNLLAALDPGRLYQANSSAGSGVASGGPYHWQPPRSWYSVDAAFKTELGSISVPTLEAIEAMMPSNDWQTVNDDWAEHDFCSGAQQGNLFPGLVASRYGPISSLADFARKSQLMNYECFRAIYEGRFAELFAPVTGVITWMSQPAQPSFVWQLYSHDLEPNASLFAVHKACEPIHVQLNQSTWHLMVVNNSTQSLSGLTALAQVYNLDGSMPYSQTNTATAGPSAVTDLGLVNFPAAGLSAVHFVKLKALNAQGQLLSDNFYWRETVQDNFQALDTLPLVSVGAQAIQQTVGGNCVINLSLTNGASVPAVMAHVQLRQASSGQRVLPVFYSDNYVSLLPGESRALTITTATTNLNGDAPLLAVDGWNVTVSPSAASGNAIAITNNAPAQASSGPLSNAARINCGGPATGFMQFGPPYYSGFAADLDYSAGSTSSTTNAVDTSASNAAPQLVYQSERWGSFNYTLPLPGAACYTMRLHFAETKWTSVGARIFSVAINGQTVLTNFDIFAAAGTSNKAVVRDFTGIVPNAGSDIVVSFLPGSVDNPKVCGIEAFASPTQSPVITVPPLNQSVATGTVATLSVGAAGAATLSYQWQCNSVDLTNSARLTGVLSSNLTISPVMFSDAGNYQVVVSNSFGSVTSAPAVLSVSAPFNPSAYARRMRLAFPCYSGAGTLTNFPVLVNLSTNLPGFQYQQFASPTGGDLRFTDASGLTLIPFEIDQWNTNGISPVWVRVPQLSGTNTYVWAFWGNPAAAQPLPAMTNGAVWNTDHLLVWHLKEPGLPYADSAARYPALAGVAPAPATGMIGQGGAFSGLTNYLDAGNVSLPSAFTLSAWFNLASNATNIQTIWANKAGGATANGFALFVNSYKTADQSVHLETGNGSAGSASVSATNAVSFGRWHLLTATVDTVANVAHLYVDGVDTIPSGGAVYPSFANASDLNLGRFLNNVFYFDGLLDEVRIASNVQTANWIWASWHSVASNVVFVSFSPVNPEPSVSVAASGDAPVLSWPATAGPLTLYTATNLSSPTVWLPVTNLPFLTNGQWQITLPAAGGSQFYRLQQ